MPHRGCPFPLHHVWMLLPNLLHQSEGPQVLSAFFPLRAPGGSRLLWPIAAGQPYMEHPGSVRGPRRVGSCLIFLPYRDYQPQGYREGKKKMKKFSVPSKDLTFSYLALTSSLSQSEPRGQERGHSAIVSLLAFPSQGFAFHLKTKQNKTKVQQANILYVP